MRQTNGITFILLISLLFLGASPASFAQPAIDGDMGDSAYSTIGTFTSGNNGFGDDNDLGEIKYYTDGTTIYLGITGELTSNDQILMAFNFSGYDGRDAGASLGAGTSGVFASIGASAMDMDTDFALAFNEGGSSTEFYVDGARFGTSGIINDGYVGNVGAQDGSSASLNVASQFGGVGNMTIAYDNGYSGNSAKGIELSIPISAFSGVDNTQLLEVFAVIVSSGGFYSNEAIPGDPGAANPGNNFNFSSVAGEDFFTSAQGLPVELARFAARRNEDHIEVHWQTLTEIDNDYFVVQSSQDGINFRALGTVRGKNTSSDLVNYSFLDESPLLGINYYRLKQVDINGRYSYSDIVNVEYRRIVTTISPNPASDAVTVMFDELSTGSVIIYSLQGLIMKEVPYVDTDELMINLEGIDSGLLILEIRDINGHTIAKKRLVKVD